MGEFLGYAIVLVIMVGAVWGTWSFWTSGQFAKDRPAPTLEGFSSSATTFEAHQEEVNRDHE